MTPDKGNGGNGSGGGGEPKGLAHALLGIAGSLVGLGAYVYLLGGFVIWLELTAARLPTDEAVKALNGNEMLAAGMKALAFELLLFGVLLLVATFLWGAARGSAQIQGATVSTAKKMRGRYRDWTTKEGNPDPGQTSATEPDDDPEPADQTEAQAAAVADEPTVTRNWLMVRNALQALVVWALAGSLLAELSKVRSLGDLPWWLFAIGGLIAALAWLVILLPLLAEWTGAVTGEAAVSRRRFAKTSLTLVAAAVAIFTLAVPAGVAVLVLLLFLHLSHLLKELPTVEKPVGLIPSVLVVAGGLSLIVAAYMATPPVSLERAVVVMEGKHHVVRGGYIGQSSDGVYLAACVPEEDEPMTNATAHLRVIAPGRIRRVVVGGGSGYVLDDGEDPSLFDVARYMVSQDPLEKTIDTVSIDLRSSRLTCGFPTELALGRRERDAQTGLSAQEVSVPSAGAVTLAGEGLRPQKFEPAHAATVSLPLRLDPETWRTQRCEGPFEIRYAVVFATRGEWPEGREATVTLSSPAGSGRADRLRACHRAYVHQAEAVPLRVVSEAVATRRNAR